MEDDILRTKLEKKNSFSGKVWKQLRLSKRKSKPSSFVSYCSDDKDSESAQSYISSPTNFQRNEVDVQNISLEQTSIQECPFDVTGYGNLLMKHKFRLKKPKRKKLIVFLFEQIIVFTTAKKNEDLYYYFGSIKICNLSLAPPSYNKTKILLKDFVNSKLYKRKIEYELQAEDEEIQQSWRDALEKCLWQQLVKAKDESQNG